MASMTIAPPAFLCTRSGAVMERPYLNLCGHLFDIAILEQGGSCPIDQYPLNFKSSIYFQELEKEISLWKRSQVVEEVSTATSSSDLTERLAILSLGDGGGASSSSTSSSEEVITPFKTIFNAHQDDIHGFALVGGCFVSGSKDNSVKIWSKEGELRATPKIPGQKTGYQYWVTALAPFGAKLWASGTRDGWINVWNLNGKLLRSMRYAPGSAVRDSYKCKQRNKSRINCIVEKETTSETTTFYTGTPGFIQLWDAKNEKMVDHYKVDSNDWVYCIQPLPENRLVVVFGSTMELWELDASPLKRSPLIQEKRRPTPSGQRAHISSVSLVESHSNLLSAAVFDGSVRLVDLTTQRESFRYQEHQGRVWSTVNLLPSLIGSCADDGLIKIWDLRQKGSIATVRGGVGRVSCLLRLNTSSFISGSCPDNPFQSEEKGTVTFWDMRKLA